MKTFEQQQQELINEFKLKMKSVCESLLSEFYTDITPYAKTDASINFKNAIRDEVYNSLVNEIANEHGMYSWAHTIRMALLKNHKDELQNKIIEDLQEKVKESDRRYFEICKRQY